MSRVALVLGLLAAMACSAMAAQCLATPDALGKGQSCNDALGCRRAFFCDKTGVCADRIAVGQPCEKQYYGCVSGASCKGEDTKTGVCIQDATFGLACNSSSFSVNPSCQSSLTCVRQGISETYLCDALRTAGFNDPCLTNNTCSLGLYCVGGFCTGTAAVGEYCRLFGIGSIALCGPNLYCNQTGNYCKELLPTGSFCSETAECVANNVCIGTSASDLTPRCVALTTRPAGEYCAGNDQVCASPSRCNNNYCSASRTTTCQNANDCALDEDCKCDGQNLAFGYGRCEKAKCYDAKVAYNTCTEQCKLTSVNSFQAFVEGGCINRNCKTQYNAYAECSPAGKATFSLIGVVFALVVALYSSASF